MVKDSVAVEVSHSAAIERSNGFALSSDELNRANSGNFFRYSARLDDSV